MRRWLTVAAVAAVMTALVPATQANAEPVSSFTRLVSGMLQPNGTDLHTRFSRDGGVTWHNSVVVDPAPGWSTLENSRWISTGSDLGLGEGGELLFRRELWLPAGVGSSSTTLCVLADGAVEARLNGTVLVDQGSPSEANGELPADCAGPVDLLRSGQNLLEFRLTDDAGAKGLDYRADVSWVNDLDAPPVLVLPEDITVDAPTGDGAQVHYSVWAYDSNSQFVPSVVCEPATGSTFQVGTTTVTCRTTGHRGAETRGSFTVTVDAPPEVPDEPPALALPGDRVVNTKSLTGARVRWTATATDDAGTPSVTCTPPSGSFFRIGTATVTCTAEDAGGLTDSGSFAVTVRGPVQRACDHLAAVRPTWSTYWLQWRLRSASTEVADAGRAADARSLRLLADRVKAAGGEYVRPALHATAVTTADRVMDRLGCP